MLGFTTAISVYPCRGRPACLPLCNDCQPYSPRYAQYAALHCRATHHRKTGQTRRFAPTLPTHVAQYAPPRCKRANITANVHHIMAKYANHLGKTLPPTASQYAPPRCEQATARVAPTLCGSPLIGMQRHDCRGDLYGRPCAMIVCPCAAMFCPCIAPQ